jgi:hypothetical protein
MSFKNLPPDLTLPPGGSLTPGSGTVYIGGPNLPASMSQFESAIIFYSDTVGLAHGIDYWYLAHFGQSHVPFTADGIQIGFYPTGGPQTLSMFGVFVDSNGRDDVTIETNTGNIILNSRRQLTLESMANFAMFIFSGLDLEMSSANGGIVYLASDFGNISFRKALGSNTEIAEIRNLGTQPNIKALNSVTIDVWQTATTTQTMNGVAGCTTVFAWRITIDWVVEVRMLFNTPVGSFFTPVPFFSFALPAAFPTIDSVAAVNNQGPHLIGIASAPQTPCSVRIDPGGTGYVFNNATPAGCNIIEVSGTFTIAKP